MSYDYFEETASSIREAEELVLQKYGDKAKIMKRRQVQKGGFLGFRRRDLVEVSGFISLEPIRRQPSVPTAGRRSHAYQGSIGAVQNSEKTGFDINKQEILKAAGQNDSVTMTKILTELKNLREDVQKPNSEETKGIEPSAIRNIREILEENEFSPKYQQQILKNCRSLSIAQLEEKNFVQQRVVEWIRESVPIYTHIPRTHPRVVALVGPTGVGKTTTIAKMAGLYCLGKIDGKERSVRIIATDNYRVGALNQIKIYADIMKVPIESATTPDDLRKWLDVYHDVDMVFIDTPGRSPNDLENLAKLASFLQVCGSKMETYLTVSASTRYSDVRQIMQQFEPFNYNSLIVTKTDEASGLGTIISVLWEKKKEVSFVGYGQIVPKDLQIATVRHFTQGLTGFSVRFNEPS